MSALIVTNANDSGAGSLRRAVELSNATPGANEITFDESLDGAVIRLVSGQLLVTDELTIDGDLDDGGRPDVTLSGDGLGNDVTNAAGITHVAASTANRSIEDNVRVLGVTSGADAVTIDGLMLTGGNAPAGEDGGAVETAADLTVSDSTIAGNVAQRGGGIAAEENSAIPGGPAGVTIVTSTLGGNRATVDGGGISMGQNRGDVTITDSTMSWNSSGGDGGAINLSFVASGATTITNSIISQNTAAEQGGGVYNWSRG